MITDARDRAAADDPLAQSIIGLLRSRGASELPHAGDATLLDHLVETYAIARRWRQPPWLQHAALLHSVYGTDAYRHRLLPPSARAEVAELAGSQAERVAYLFSTTDRGSLIEGVRSQERDALLLLHMANIAEQARARDGSPGEWLAMLAKLAEPLVDSETVSLPLFIAELATLSAADEALVRRGYVDALSETDDLSARADRLALVAATCAVTGEPCVWLADLARRRGDSQAARWWSGRARRRLLELGAAWDKRLRFDEWLALAEQLENAKAGETPASAGTLTHPGALFEATMNAALDNRSRHAARVPGPRRAPNAGTERFNRYIATIGDSKSRMGAIYPDLHSSPWYEPQDFPLVAYLESHYAAIRAELLGLDPQRFHRESERIRRSGDWDVAFLYERGLRHDELCAACPVTTRGIEAYPTVRGPAGLIYVSRMRPSTHIEAHRGPTNLRIRCHLGLRVPDGDCAIRVGAEIRQWREGRCLVFDDHFEHEAWNHTDEERIVLIVDLWHPELSSAEIRLLEGLQRHTYAHARRLGRYWSANADAAG